MQDLNKNEQTNQQLHSSFKNGDKLFPLASDFNEDPITDTFERPITARTSKLLITGITQKNFDYNQLRSIFGRIGELEDIDLADGLHPTHGRGCAYITYKKPVDAECAMLKFDGIKIDDSIIHLAPIFGDATAAGNCSTNIKPHYLRFVETTVKRSAIATKPVNNNEDGKQYKCRKTLPSHTPRPTSPKRIPVITPFKRLKPNEPKIPRERLYRSLTQGPPNWTHLSTNNNHSNVCKIKPACEYTRQPWLDVPNTYVSTAYIPTQSYYPYPTSCQYWLPSWLTPV